MKAQGSGKAAHTKKPSAHKETGIAAPPQYPLKPQELTFHGDTRTDPFFYFRDPKKQSTVKKWLAQENAFTSQELNRMCGEAHSTLLSAAEQPDNGCSFPPPVEPQKFENLEKRLYQDMKKTWKETDTSLPSKERGYWYFSRTLEGAEHPIYCRVPFTPKSSNLLELFSSLLFENPKAQIPHMEGEEVMLDVNMLQEELGAKYFEIGDFDVSDDETKLLLTVDLSDGQEIFTILLLDLAASAATQPVGQTKAKWKVGTKNRHSKAHEASPHFASPHLASPHFASPHLATPKVNSGHTHHILQTIEMFPNSSEVLWHTPHTFFYFALDDTQRPYRLVYHDLRLPSDSEEADVLLFEEADAQFWCTSLCYSDDEKFVLFCTASKLTEEWHCVPVAFDVPLHVTSELQKIAVSAEACDEEGRAAVITVFRPFSVRSSGLEYDIAHHDSWIPLSSGGEAMEGGWIIASNRGACSNFVIDYCPDSAVSWSLEEGGSICSMSLWRPLFAYNDEIKVDGVQCTKHFILISVRRKGFPAAFVVPIDCLRAAMRNAEDLPLSLTQSPHVVIDALSLLPPPDASDHYLCGVGERCDDWTQVFNIDVGSGSEDYDCDTLRLFVHHMVFPGRMYQVRYSHPASTDGAEAKAYFSDVRLMREEHINGPPYDPGLYTVRRLWVTPTHNVFPAHAQRSSSGHPVKIPMTVCYRNDLFREGGNPAMITGYGSYGDSTDPEFSSERLVILDRGVVYAVANVRGGGELGREWRDSGRMEYRIQTIYDFIDCSQFLVAEGLCHPQRLCSLGGSAGGTVVSAAMLLGPPHLYHAVLSLVPFVDCLSTMLDPSIPLTTAEWEEWGNPLEDKRYYDAIKAYSPMDLLTAVEGSPDRANCFPRFLFLESGYGDPRVPHWEPMAFGARVRGIVAAKQPDDESADGGSTVVLHKCNLEAGHGGASGRYESLKELATEYAFLLAACYSEIPV